MKISAEEVNMDYIDWFLKRPSELRLQRNVSARNMRLSLGQSESYINNIENKRSTFFQLLGILREKHSHSVLE